ncbi:hypothetical protein CTAYLR_007690 [Chrysophaeum taylorii]|uniref:Large ribosomal subunit protein mL49 n=1 Tax=Chrysophaeum taylorii TaxID=2483200 RepID=A0AAD7XK18_9STRA|nr:hypothetical protein CTAYLR_007690 [Chrysophaeum taylorii]
MFAAAAAKQFARASVRGVHSKRQVKRMNVPRLRKAGLLKPQPKPEPPVLPPAPNELANGWTPPPDNVPTTHPFAILRSKNGWLPVYTRYRQHMPYTKVRYVYGDVQAFMSQLEAITYSTPACNAGGSITTVSVKGNHVTNVRRWLTSLGF